MNRVLLPVQARVTFEGLYRHPVLDKLTEAEVIGGAELPAAPQMTFVAAGSCGWFTVDGATFYVVQRLLTGTDYSDIASVADDGQSEMTLVSGGEITGPGYYRVRAGNTVGLGPPSAPMDLNVTDNVEPVESS